MNYLLIGTDSNIKYICSTEYWLALLNIARENGWKPEGTYYDLQNRLDECREDILCSMTRMFSFICINNEYIEWDGNYTDMKGQVVSEVDAYQMMLSIEGYIQDRSLSDLLSAGAFRIFSCTVTDVSQ